MEEKEINTEEIENHDESVEETEVEETTDTEVDWDSLFEKDEEEPEEEVEETDEPEDEDDGVEITYNKQKVKVKKDEQIPLLQKGMNYDKVMERLMQKEKEMAELAKLYGKDPDTSYQELRQQLLESRAEEEGLPPETYEKQLRMEQELTELKNITRKTQIQADMESLKSKPFFDELKEDVERLLESDPVWRAEDAYIWLRGQRLEELLQQEKSSTQKSTIANLQDKARRGTVRGQSGAKGKKEKPLSPLIQEAREQLGLPKRSGK